MKTVGIIAEFNPFHCGHEYIINEAKRATGADRCVIAMSGDFVQRGTPAVCGKSLRARMALLCGADAVFELPVPYATASAEIFAEAGVKLFNSLGNVDCIAFGSECPDISVLTDIARILNSESDLFKSVLQEKLKDGFSFPAARDAAFEAETGDPGLTAVLRSPNNILAIEYCRAALRLAPAGSDMPAIEPAAVRRVGSGYHDNTIVAHMQSSATALRAALEDPDGDTGELIGQVPDAVLKLIDENYRCTLPITADDLNEQYDNSPGAEEVFHFTAYDEKGIAGHINIRFPEPGNIDTVRLGYVIVSPERRGKGLGREMIGLTLKFAFDIMKAKKVTIGVFDVNVPALNCYLASGFKDTGRSGDFSYHGEKWKCRELETVKGTE